MSSSSSPLLATHANCLPIGTVIGDFEIIGLVGEGGFGIVYMARDTTLDRVVALKEFMPAAFAGRVDGLRVSVRASNHQTTYDAGLRSFINEAKMLAKFAHHALVEVYRFWEGNGTAYMAMRFYPGETLRQHLSRGDTTFDEDFIAQTMAPIFDALEILHREQIFHRDIAPDNIILSDGRPVLLDFGSARRIIGDGTQALTTVLKPGYAPIEQYVDDGTMKQGPWTDVYALGGVLYHLATGKVPLQAVSRLLSDPLQTVNQVTNNAFSPQFSEAVAKAMAVRLENRLQTVREFSQMLGWNTVQSSRVVTLPNARLARQEVDKTAAVAQDTAAEQSASLPATTVSETVSNASPVVSVAPVSADVMGELSAGSEAPAYPTHPRPPSTSRSTWVAGLAAVAVIIVTGYWYLAPSSGPAPAVLPSAAQPVPITPAKDLPAPSVPIQAEPSAVAPVVTTGKLSLNIIPWGTVVIDGVTRGISNSSQLREIELSVGTHTVEIAKPDARPLLQTIEVTANAPVSISHAFK